MDDPMVGCPFEMAHWCKQSRLQKHLIKCRKNHPESELEPCPYNATEYIHPDNLVEHLKVCKNAKLLEGLKYDAERLRDNYLDAPYHVPTLQKPESETEDFENEGIQYKSYDEQILERSVSQMSVNSGLDFKPPEYFDKNPSPFRQIQSRGSSTLPSRSSILRNKSAGRGHVMADIISALSEIDEMDYGKYEIRSTVSNDDSKFEDLDSAPISRTGPVPKEGMSLLPGPQKFEDRSSDEEANSDNASACGSELTIIENDRKVASIENTVQPSQMSEPRFPCLLSDSEDEEEEVEELEDRPNFFDTDSDVDDIAAITFPTVDNATRNGHESSSEFSGFSSLIRANSMQNAQIVQSFERKKTWNRGRGTLLQSSNQDLINSNRHWNKNGRQRGGINENRFKSRNCANQQEFSNYQGQPLQNQNNYQQEMPHYSSNSQNQTSQFNQQKFRGNYHNSAGRGVQQDLNGRDMSHSEPIRRGNSVGRGVLLENPGMQPGIGNSIRGGNAAASQFRGNFIGANRDNYNSQGDINRSDSYNAGSSGRGSSCGRGNKLSDSYNQDYQTGNLGNVVGRGQSNVQLKSSGRGDASNQFSSGGNAYKEKSMGRGNLYSKSAGHGSLFSHPGNGDYDRTSVGRGRAMTMMQSTNNFRGKFQPEISHDSFQAVYDSFKDLQIVDFSPASNSSGKNKPRANFKVPSVAGSPPKPSPFSTSALPVDLNVNPSASSMNKAKKKKNRKKKTVEQTSSKPTEVDSSAEAESISKSSQQPQSGPNIKILDRSMDPKKYFGGDGCKDLEPKQDSSLDKPKSNINDSKTAKKKVHFKDRLARRDKYEVYDMFYSQISSFSLNNGINVDEDQSIQQVSQPNYFSERIEAEKPVRAYASVNCIQVSSNVAKSSQENSPSSNNIPTNVHFSSLHSPQKPKVPSRYDKLSDTASYKFVFRHMNKRQANVNRKNKPIAKKVNKSFKAQTVTDRENLVPNEKKNVTFVPRPDTLSNSKPLSQQPADNFNFRNDGGFTIHSSYNSQPQSQNQIFEKSYSNFSLNNKKSSAHQSTKSFKSKNSFVKSHEMSLWSQNPPMNPKKTPLQGKNPSLNPNEMSLWTKSSFRNQNKTSSQMNNSNEMSLWNKNSYSAISAVDGSDYNSFQKRNIPQYENFCNDGVKNFVTKKPALAVSKKKMNHVKSKNFNRNSNASGQLGSRYRNTQSFLRSIYSNPLEKPIIYGPSQSRQPQHSSKKPLAFSPFNST
nr:PREDICTED: dentin sialophosphoprotein-like [Bemisia tabaci]